ncbi:unnamed protein product, partial [marine sediment metagenome]
LSYTACREHKLGMESRFLWFGVSLGNLPGSLTTYAQSTTAKIREMDKVGDIIDA